MKQVQPPSGYVFIVQGKAGSERRIQLRDPYFDLLGQARSDDPENLKNLFARNGYAQLWPQLHASLGELPAGKFVSIDYERGLQREDPGI